MNRRRRKIISNGFSHQFIHILCIHLSQLMRLKQDWLPLCATVSVRCAKMLHANNLFSLLCSRCLRIFGSLVRSMKKFCSSLSSFTVICLQLNKICKFKAAAAASHRKIVVTIKNSKEMQENLAQFSQCQQIEKWWMPFFSLFCSAFYSVLLQ